MHAAVAPQAPRRLCRGWWSEEVGQWWDHRQLSLRRDDEVQVPEAHVHTWDPAEVVTSLLRPGVDVETRKRSLPGVPTIGVSSCHQQVNF